MFDVRVQYPGGIRDGIEVPASVEGNLQMITTGLIFEPRV